MKNIIVIDDDATLLKTISMFLRTEYFNVTDCNTPIKGYIEFKSKKPDLVITDLNMPQSTGIDYIHKIREVDQKTPVIAMSANTTLLHTLVPYQSELNVSILPKPFMLPDLKALIDKILENPGSAVIELSVWKKRLEDAKARFKRHEKSSDLDGVIVELYLIYRLYFTVELLRHGYNFSHLMANEGFSLTLPTEKKSDILHLYDVWPIFQIIKSGYLALLTENKASVISLDTLKGYFDLIEK